MKLCTKWTSTPATTELVCKISNRKKILRETEISLGENMKPINSETNNEPQVMMILQQNFIDTFQVNWLLATSGKQMGAQNEKHPNRGIQNYLKIVK